MEVHQSQKCITDHCVSSVVDCCSTNIHKAYVADRRCNLEAYPYPDQIKGSMHPSTAAKLTVPSDLLSFQATAAVYSGILCLFHVRG